jgi:hypothetical protein
MSRGQGRVFRPKVTNRGRQGTETAVWWLDYGVHGTHHRQSTGTISSATQSDCRSVPADGVKGGREVPAPESG